MAPKKWSAFSIKGKTAESPLLCRYSGAGAASSGASFFGLEPASLALVCIGMLASLSVRRRRRG
jgi:hypothetical protein